MEKTSVMILRFRDLICENEDTIIKHNECIKCSGFTWWGWWGKKDEKVPSEEFVTINRLGKEVDSQITTYLYDSGNKKLYKTKCEKVEFSTDEENISSPVCEATPEYYNKTKFLAWYKFIEEIREVDLNTKELRNYSYYLTSSTLQKGQLIDLFGKLDNKIISGLDELQHQDRTIWFARPKVEGDSDEILIFNQIRQGNTKQMVDQEPQFIKSKKLLWLSDIHFASGDALSKHAFKHKPADNNSLQTVLMESLKSTQKKINIGSLIISGDLAYTVSEEEFTQAARFMNYLNAELGLEREQSLIIPGNHDLKFDDTEEENGEDDAQNVEIEELTEDSKMEYIEFCRKYFDEEPNKHLYSIRRFITKDFVPLEIIGINSLALQQYRGKFQGMGYIGDDQIREITNELRSFEEKYGTPNRIIVIHQHIMPVSVEQPELDRMYSLVLDSEKMVEKLVKEFNVRAVLHGHTHRDFYSKQIRQIGENKEIDFSVIGIGSAGVSQDERGEEPNVYGILEVNHECIEVKIYEISSANVKQNESPRNVYKIEL